MMPQVSVTYLNLHYSFAFQKALKRPKAAFFIFLEFHVMAEFSKRFMKRAFSWRPGGADSGCRSSGLELKIAGL